MTSETRHYRIGDVTVTKIPEVDLASFSLGTLLPGFRAEALNGCPEGIAPKSGSSGMENIVFSVHTWLVRTPEHTILIDTGIGNGKNHPSASMFHQLDTPYLDRLGAEGVEPEEVDYVLLTHLHAEHVGWNTRLDEDGVWVPTFPNATYMFSAVEQRYGAGLHYDDGRAEAVRSAVNMGTPVRTPTRGTYLDSVAPILEAGRDELIKVDGREVLEGISFVPTPGHSIDHAAIVLRSKGEEALFGGDVLHHPVEIYQPEVASMFCEFPTESRGSRLILMDRAAETGATYFSSHFSDSSAGRITRKGSSYGWEFV